MPVASSGDFVAMAKGRAAAGERAVRHYLETHLRVDLWRTTHSERCQSIDVECTERFMLRL